MTALQPKPRPLAAALVAASAFGLSGCGAPAPSSITWYGNRTAVTEGPRVYCEITERLDLDCSEVDGPVATLRLGPEDPVQINIPGDVAERPWWLVISYENAADSFRTPLFDDGRTLSYTVRPEPGRQLQQIDVQVPTVTVGPTGEPQWTPYQAWVLVIEPA